MGGALIGQFGGADYVRSPDMVAFTIGRLVCAKVAGGREVSLAGLILRLQQIADGTSDYLPEGVSQDMAAAALNHLLSTVSKAA